MTLIAILALALLLAAVWRLARLVVKLLLLGALIALIASYGTSATPRRTPPQPARSQPPNQPRRPPGATRSPGLRRRPRAPVKQRPVEGRR